MRAGLLAVLLTVTLAAAEPPAYRLAITPTDNAEIDAAIAATSALKRLADQPLDMPATLLARARGDRDRAESALRGLGYFDADVRVTLAGLELDDPALPARLAAAAKPIPVIFAIRPGPRTSIGSLRLLDPGGNDLAAETGLPELATRAGLAIGAPARGADIVAAEARVLRALQEDGRAFARIGARTLTLDRGTHQLEVVLRFDPARQVRIDDVTVLGLTRLKPAMAGARMAPFTGQLLTPAALDRARRSLLDLGVFAAVRAETAIETGAGARVRMQASELPPRHVGLTAAYATTEGGSVGATWLHRNLFGHAERLALDAELNHIGAGAPGDLGYRLAVALTRPDFLALHQELRVGGAAFRELTDAYDKTAVTGAIAVRRALSPRLSAGLGVSVEQSRITDTLGINHYTLVGLPAVISWRNTGDSLLDIRRGLRTEFRITPYPVAAGSDPGLTILKSDTAIYQPLDADARSILALRAQFAFAAGATTPTIPADLRLFAGGSGTIRGFAFQSVGPLDANGKPLGGTSLVAGTVELRQRLFGPWGMVAFADAGGVSGERAPAWPERMGVGAGLGVRYHTSFGPIRADVGFPVSGKRTGDAVWQLYAGFGQAF